MTSKRLARCPNCRARWAKRVRRPLKCPRCQHVLNPVAETTVIVKAGGRQVFRGYASRYARDHGVNRADADRIQGLELRNHLWLGGRGGLLVKRIS